MANNIHAANSKKSTKPIAAPRKGRPRRLPKAAEAEMNKEHPTAKYSCPSSNGTNRRKWAIRVAVNIADQIAAMKSRNIVLLSTGPFGSGCSAQWRVMAKL
jgi:hypothetical protein